MPPGDQTDFSVDTQQDSERQPASLPTSPVGEEGWKRSRERNPGQTSRAPGSGVGGTEGSKWVPKWSTARGHPSFFPQNPLKLSGGGWWPPGLEAASAAAAAAAHSPGAVKKVTQPESAFEATPARAPEPNLKKPKWERRACGGWAGGGGRLEQPGQIRANAPRPANGAQAAVSWGCGCREGEGVLGRSKWVNSFSRSQSNLETFHVTQQMGQSSTPEYILFCLWEPKVIY